ncbi:LLM class flavin-dependent oxidoreductase [Tsuneonella sp. CC-YZS046]|uniref:LLM class flavin-dependent oxidoreductase n=1 Tax=Tsuneonella sp. CC-YZS046 TaxID=3042152 RepID=UPI002D76DF90|nr:LLM class flavin-dependent oxidoreductase [Tsuneonella sp. CC-YZS046]WRO67234.1 LLM class flavin-dependent oxidoreductase [Tsuneonella sp. CC-YZS046]
MRFGAFIAPHTPTDEHPSLGLEEDMDRVVWMEKLGFDEAWIGEHHSSGWEINGSPEIFIAAVSQRTSRIKLGTGVVSLPYHNPFTVADRIRQLDHITKGRTILGMGPGSLPSDAYMMGIPTAEARDRMEQAIEPIVRLLNNEIVTAKTDWFNLQEARLQLDPYNDDGVEIAAASQVSPTGARAAGKFGLSMLSIGATSAGGFNALASNWAIAEETAAEHGNQMDRNGWRLVGPVHVAETREKARENVRYGLERWIEYMSQVAAIPLAPPPGQDPVDYMIETGFGVIGTPDDFVAQMNRLSEQSGGFGCFLNLDNHWADWEQTKRSYELIARFAIPKINKLNESRIRSETWLRENNAHFKGELTAAVRSKMEEYAREKGMDKLSPDLVAHFKANS